jgi:hypothetical protein
LPSADELHPDSRSLLGLTYGGDRRAPTEVHGAEESRQTITATTDRVMKGLAEWRLSRS